VLQWPRIPTNGAFDGQLRKFCGPEPVTRGDGEGAKPRGDVIAACRPAGTPALRFEGTAGQHGTIFLASPSNNVIEFRNYDDPRLQYLGGGKPWHDDGRTLPVPETPGAPRRDPGGTPEPEAPGSSPGPQAAGTLWLVRHGESGWNVAGRIQGQLPAAPGLTATGREQAAHAARELARRAPRAGLIVASDLTRAAETAGIIADHLGLPVQFDPALREQSLGDLEGQSAFVTAEADGSGRAEGARGTEDGRRMEGNRGTEDDPGTVDLLDAFWADPFRKPPGGESVAEMYDRVRRALDRIAASRPGADLIIVTHGGPVRVATAVYPPARGQAFPRTAVANASIALCHPARPATPHVSR